MLSAASVGQPSLGAQQVALQLRCRRQRDRHRLDVPNDLDAAAKQA